MCTYEKNAFNTLHKTYLKISKMFPISNNRRHVPVHVKIGHSLCYKLSRLTDKTVKSFYYSYNFCNFSVFGSYVVLIPCLFVCYHKKCLTMASVRFWSCRSEWFSMGRQLTNWGWKKWQNVATLKTTLKTTLLQNNDVFTFRRFVLL